MANPTTEAIYRFICAYIEQYGHAPTQREIAAGCYLARSSVVAHLNKLEKQGRIRRVRGMARTIHLPKR